MNASKYLNSRLGKTIEEMKTAYLSGKHIIFLVTTEPEFVIEIIESESILPLKKWTKANGLKEKANKSNLDFEHSFELSNMHQLEEPSFFVYQLGGSSLDKIESKLKSYVNLCCGFSTINENLSFSGKKGIENLRQSLILVVVDSRINVPLYLDPYSEIVTVPYVSKEEFDVIVSKLVHDLEVCHYVKIPNM